MAVHEDSSSHRKSNDFLDEISTFNVENMQNNTIIINYSRTFMSIIGGVIAGVLGFTGLMGFILYFIIMAITTFGLAAKTGFAVHSYFDSWNRIVFDGILGGLLSFVLFWTILQGVGPIQVRYAVGEGERLGSTEYKLFVGSLNKQATEKYVEEVCSVA